MTLSEALAQSGMELNAPVQSTANNPNVPGPVASIATICGNSVQYALGPSAFLVIVTVGYDPELPPAV